MTIRVTDLTTGKVEVIRVADETSKRVMRRAVALYNQAKRLQVKGKLLFSYYLKYSWQLEKGHVWA